MLRKRPITIRTSRPQQKRPRTVRGDISCGVQGCMKCASINRNSNIKPKLDSSTVILIPDVASAAGFPSFIGNLSNILLLSTVLETAAGRSRESTAKLRQLVARNDMATYVMPNDLHHELAGLRLSAAENVVNPSKQADDDVAQAASWLATHLSEQFPDIRIVVLVADTSSTILVPHASVRIKTLREQVAFSSTEESGQLALFDTIKISEVTQPRERVDYTEHWSAVNIDAASVNGTILIGKFVANPRSCFFGHVRVTYETSDRVLICGSQAVNRAIHGDVVALELLGVEEWRPPRSKKDVDNIHTTEADALAEGFTPTARVVAIIERGRHQFCGSINPTSNITSGYVHFVPKSRRYPRISIASRDIPVLQGMLLVATLDEWSCNSFYPRGHYDRILGHIGDPEAEATVILMENNIPYYDFSPAVYDCLPKGDWNVSATDRATRLDLTELLVCSVDPPGCKDIDDALHYRKLGDGLEEVGVHIADVTHFVLPETAIDNEAANRGTSVYLVDRRISMLPELLTENLCSLVANGERLTFSVIWKFRAGTTEIVEEKFARAIIRSRAAFSYEEAQKRIDNNEDSNEITENLRALIRMSTMLKKERHKQGALVLGSNEFKITINPETHEPIEMKAYETFDTNFMIEEWMLFANIAAARTILNRFSQLALLRCHPAPSPHSFEALNAALRQQNVSELDATTSGSLNKSLSCVAAERPDLDSLVRLLCTRCLYQAQYFASGDRKTSEYQHYGLAVPLYTHFTSPIRRYADVIVHRQLAAVIGSGDPFSSDLNVLTTLAGVLNYRNVQAQQAERDSKNLYAGFYLERLKKKESLMDEHAFVIGIDDDAITVLVPRYGQERRLDLPNPSFLETLKIFDSVTVGVSVVHRDGVDTLEFLLCDPAPPEEIM